MAKATATATKSEPTIKPDRVKIKIPRIPGVKEQPDYIIAVNGFTYQIQRGVDVYVPRKVVKAIELFNRQREESEQIIFSLEKDD